MVRSNEVSIYQKHLRDLVTKIYKSLEDINPDFMKPYFIIKKKKCLITYETNVP